MITGGNTESRNRMKQKQNRKLTLIPERLSLLLSVNQLPTVYTNMKVHHEAITRMSALRDETCKCETERVT